MPRAALLSAHLGGRRMTDREAARAPDIGNSIRYAATTGTVAIRREGARAPTIWTVPAPGLEPDEGRAVDVLRARPGAPDETESYVRGSGWVRGS